MMVLMAASPATVNRQTKKKSKKKKKCLVNFIPEYVCCEWFEIQDKINEIYHDRTKCDCV